MDGFSPWLPCWGPECFRPRSKGGSACSRRHRKILGDISMTARTASDVEPDCGTEAISFWKPATAGKLRLLGNVLNERPVNPPKGTLHSSSKNLRISRTTNAYSAMNT